MSTNGTKYFSRDSIFSYLQLSTVNCRTTLLSLLYFLVWPLFFPVWRCSVVLKWIDWIIFDEVHNCLNYKLGRSKSFYGSTWNSKIVIFPIWLLTARAFFSINRRAFFISHSVLIHNLNTYCIISYMWCQYSINLL